MPAIGIFGLPEGYMTVKDFANKLGISENTIRTAIRYGRIKTSVVRMGEIVDEKPGSLVIHESELEKIRKKI